MIAVSWAYAKLGIKQRNHNLAPKETGKDAQRHNCEAKNKRKPTGKRASIVVATATQNHRSQTHKIRKTAREQG